MSGFKTGALGLGHVVLRSATPKESVTLLTDALGRHHSVAFQPGGANLPRSRDKKQWHFMLETNSLDDVDTALDVAVKTGTPLATTLGRHSSDQMVSFYMVTPSGFEVERHDRGTLWGHTVQLAASPVPAAGVPTAGAR